MTLYTDLNVKCTIGNAPGISPQQIRFINDAGCFLQGEVFARAGEITSR